MTDYGPVLTRGLVHVGPPRCGNASISFSGAPCIFALTSSIDEPKEESKTNNSGGADLGAGGGRLVFFSGT